MNENFVERVSVQHLQLDDQPMARAIEIDAIVAYAQDLIKRLGMNRHVLDQEMEECAYDAILLHLNERRQQYRDAHVQSMALGAIITALSSDIDRLRNDTGAQQSDADDDEIPF